MKTYQNRRLVVAVLGYGCELNEGLENYLAYIQKFCQHIENIKAVICLGGETNRLSKPGRTEAQILKYLGVKQHVYMDDQSISTLQNIEALKKILRQNLLQKYRLVIFADSAHSLKARLLGRLVLGYWPEIIKIDLTKNLRKTIWQLLIATPLDVATYFIRPLRNLAEKRKARIMARS